MRWVGQLEQELTSIQRDAARVSDDQNENIQALEAELARIRHLASASDRSALSPSGCETDASDVAHLVGDEEGWHGIWEAPPIRPMRVESVVVAGVLIGILAIGCLFGGRLAALCGMGIVMVALLFLLAWAGRWYVAREAKEPPALRRGRVNNLLIERGRVTTSHFVIVDDERFPVAAEVHDGVKAGQEVAVEFARRSKTVRRVVARSIPDMGGR